MTTTTRKEYDEEGTQSLWGLPYKEVVEEWDGSVTSDGLSIDDAFNIDEIDITDTAGSTGLVSLVERVAEVQTQERFTNVSASDISISGFALNDDGTVDLNTPKNDELTEVAELKGKTIAGISILGAYKTDGTVSYVECNIDFMYNQGNGVFTIVPQEHLSQLASLLPDGCSYASTNASVNTDGGWRFADDDTKLNTYCLGVFSSENFNPGVYLFSINCGVGGIIPKWVYPVVDFTGMTIKNVVDNFIHTGFYNTNGLVFMLDMCYKCSAENWTDMIENVVFSGVGMTLTNGVPTFGSTSAKYTNSDELAYNYGSATIEIAYKADADNLSTNRKIFGLKSGTLSYGMLSDNRGVIASSGSCQQFAYLTHGTLTSASIIGDGTAYFNKSAIVSSSSNSWGNQSVNSIGNGSNYSNFTGCIYSIRIYNRILSEDEIIANQTIDLARFNDL